MHQKLAPKKGKKGVEPLVIFKRWEPLLYQNDKEKRDFLVVLPQKMIGTDCTIEIFVYF